MIVSKSKIAFVIACTLSLSACLKVDNKSNEKVANAVTAQTQVLQSQKTSISLGGIVKNLSTDSKVLNATVTVKTGVTVSAPIAVTNGAFVVENLPVDSDYELIIHSTTGAFMDRTQFGKTRATTSPGNIYQDLGIISVAAGVERKFSILNTNTSAPITNLILHANSNIGTGANFEQYLHTATYDAATQQYKITIPEHMDIAVYANLDMNNDSKIDFLSESSLYGSGDTLVIDSAYVKNSNPIYLFDLNTNGVVKIKLSLLDAALKPILNAKPIISDAINGVLTASYDAATEQYIFKAIIVNQLSVLVPAITVGDTTYTSSTVQIYKVPDADGLSYSIASTQGFGSLVRFNNGEEKIFNIVQRPIAMVNGNISVSAQSTAIDAVSQGFKVFYSNAIGIAENSATLIKKNVVQVVKGDQSASDFVVPGSTWVEIIDESIAVDTQLSLDDTLLTVKPKVALEAGYSYKYDIGQITDAGSKAKIDLYNDSLDFDIKGSGIFDISSMTLDNNNYFNQGAIIKPTNSAGGSSFITSQTAPVYAYFPVALGNVKKLVIRKEAVVQDDVVTNDVQDITVVNNGQLNASLFNTVSVANNENMVGSFANAVQRGAALTDGRWYALSVGEYMNDNSTLVANTIRFSYILEGLDGVQKTGVITLPVN